MPDDEVQIGVIGTDNTHAYPFTAMLNGWAEDVPIPATLPNGARVADMYLWGTYLRQQLQDQVAGIPVTGARVTSLWSSDPAEAELLAKACGIENVAETPDDVCVDVDGAMVLSERPETHLPYARLALERGLPTFVDKPLAESAATGRELFDIARRHGAACFTGSALRWSPSLVAARQHVETRFGPAQAMYVPCPLELELYGIHAVEMVNLFMGHAVATVQAMGHGDRQVVLLNYTDGRSAVFEHLNFVTWPMYSASIYGHRWDHRIVMDDIGATFLGLVRTFVDVVRGAPAPVPAEESLRLVEIVFAAQEALRTREVVTLG